MGISLQELAGGALQEKADQAFSKVMHNMLDLRKRHGRTSAKSISACPLSKMRKGQTVPVILPLT